MTRKSHQTIAAGLLPSTKLNAAEMNRRAAEFLKSRGNVLPYRRTALSKHKEFAR